MRTDFKNKKQTITRKMIQGNALYIPARVKRRKGYKKVVTWYNKLAKRLGNRDYVHYSHETTPRSDCLFWTWCGKKTHMRPQVFFELMAILTNSENGCILCCTIFHQNNKSEGPIAILTKVGFHECFDEADLECVLKYWDYFEKMP